MDIYKRDFMFLFMLYDIEVRLKQWLLTPQALPAHETQYNYPFAIVMVRCWHKPYYNRSFNFTPINKN
jgi:hypothetical protein